MDESGQAGSQEREQPHVPPAQGASSSERTWATFCHLAAFSVLLRIPVGLIAGPLVVWLIKRNDSSFVDRHGKAAVNFQLRMRVYFVVVMVFGRVVFSSLRVVLIDLGRPVYAFLRSLWLVPLRLPFGTGTAFVLLPLVVALLVLDVVCTIVAAVRANTGREYRYPFTIPFIR
jgi:uncharacterized Tic20 family protein